MSAIDLIPRTPSRTSTRVVRTSAVLGVLVISGFWIWQLALDGGPGPISALGALAIVALGTATKTLWAWAIQPRLTEDQQWAVAAALTKPDRRVLARALRRDERPSPALDEPWAATYAYTQHPLKLSASYLLLMGAIVTITVTGQGVETAWNRVLLVVAVLSVVGGIWLLWWVHRLETTAGRWARTTSRAGTAGPW